MAGPPADDRKKRLPRRSATRTLRKALELEDIPPELGRVLRPRVRVVPTVIADLIMTQVSAYARTGSPERRRLILRASRGAGELFLDIVEGHPTAPEVVVDTFAGLGFHEGAAGHSLDALRGAFEIATLRVSRELREQCDRAEPAVSVAIRDRLVAASVDFFQLLMGVVVKAHGRGVRHYESDPATLRRRLGETLARGGDLDEATTLAARLSWPMPAEVVVCRIEVEPARVATLRLPTSALRVDDGDAALVIVGLDAAETVVERLRSVPDKAPVIVSEPVPLGEVRQAFAWVRRAGVLIVAGVIPAPAVVRCADYRAELALYADPELNRRQSLRVLAPLELVGSLGRTKMAETLLLWLAGRLGPHEVARELGVSERTARYRIARLRAVFGEILDDPKSVAFLILALRAELGHGAS